MQPRPTAAPKWVPDQTSIMGEAHGPGLIQQQTQLLECSAAVAEGHAKQMRLHVYKLQVMLENLPKASVSHPFFVDEVAS